MKKLEFKTIKGAFFMVDAIERKNLHDGIFLKQITEEQASEIMPSYNKLYNTYTYKEAGYMTTSAISSLHSLLKSKGIHLFENPYPDAGLMPSYEQQLYREAKSKTFYNPVIFKL